MSQNHKMPAILCRKYILTLRFQIKKKVDPHVCLTTPVTPRQPARLTTTNAVEINRR